eukprot:CAMPEP_0196723316 /NCGR_PEP_ID=MMETSP1091-20130531/5454_1 /TAXON_ID=302021 /ORGANISM="Rhodomonas sp., Strain CCMP768" /LENGTH=94 /DNA_ID=CAMNT_0042065203 /DNA_START=291 /DNA_END=572 /DNA_ORIENTATION=-
MTHVWCVGVCAEGVLLTVGGTEQVEAEACEEGEEEEEEGTEASVVSGEIPCGEGVGEGHPREVTKAQHEPEPFSGDVHGSENCMLVVEGVPHVQ